MASDVAQEQRAAEPPKPKGTTADILIETIADWGVDTVFGLPGDGIDGIMEALRTHADRVKFVQVRHEEAAAFMACAYSKFTGRLAACLATSGPGGIHLLNGLYDAKLDSRPVLAITGHTYHDLIGTHYQQDVDLDKLFMDVSVYNERVMGPHHVQNVAALACRTALARRGVAHITIPTDIQSWTMGTGELSKDDVPRHPSLRPAPRTGPPGEADLNAAAAILNGGRKVCILAGQGAQGCGDLLEQAAERLGAPVVKALLGKDVLPDVSPYSVGGAGLVGTKPGVDALSGCDTLLIVGSSFPYMHYYPKPGEAKAVQIDIDGERIGLRYPIDVGLVGDARETLTALLPRLDRHDDRSFLEEAQAGWKDWLGVLEQRGTSAETPLKPEVVAYFLNKHLSDDAIIVSDSGTIATWAARQVLIRGRQRFSLSGNLATMGNGLPYANAAQFAYPDRQVVGIVGDGGFTMLMGEFATAVKYQLPIKLVIIKNNMLGQILWEQMVFLGNPQYGVELQPINFAKYAEACGATGITIDDPSNADELMRRALNTPGPVIIEAVTDALEPPMPPDIKFEQIQKVAEAMAHGQPNRVRIGETMFRDRVRDILAPDGEEEHGFMDALKEKGREIFGLDDKAGGNGNGSSGTS